jgi:hypothetical protein
MNFHGSKEPSEPGALVIDLKLKQKIVICQGRIILTLLSQPSEALKKPLSRAGPGTTRIGVIRKTGEQKNAARQT